MKNIFYGFLFTILIIGSIWFASYFYKKNNTPQITYKTEKLVKKNIYKKTLATGKINPRIEVNMKSSVSGIIEEIYVQTGTYVKKGDLLAKIKIIPNARSITQAKSSIKMASIGFDNAHNDLERNKGLFENGIIPRREYESYVFNFNVRKQELSDARQNLRVINTGAASNSKRTLTNIRATIEGTILAIGGLVGDHITEANTFTEGTTIATVADMSSVFFAGKVEESEVGKLKVGLPIVLKIGAIENVEFEAVLDFIAPKGIERDRTIKFAINATITIPDSINLRAGYSANAEIILEVRENVFTMSEGNLLFENDSTFVEVQTTEQYFEKRNVITGLSDGLYVEIVSGIDSTDVIKVQNSGE